MDGADDLRRELGPWTAYSLVAGSMIGTGIFFFVSPVAANLRTAAEILGVWACGIAIAGSGALCVAELAAAYPRTGGVYVFLREAFGPLTAFLYTWSKFLILRVGSLGVATLAFADFACTAAGLDPEQAQMYRLGVALIALWAVTIANATDVRSGAAIQVTLTLLKLASLALLVLVGLAFTLGILVVHPAEIAIAPPPVTDGGWMIYAVALVPVLWTLGGWDESPFVAGEVRDPERNLPLSIIGGLVSVGIAYLLVVWAYLQILTPDELAGSATRTATVVIERALGAQASGLLAIVLMISTLGAANGLALTGARIAFAAGRDHRFLAPLAVASATSRVPLRALILQAALTSTVLLTLRDPFELVLYTAVAYWIFTGLMACAVIVLRRSDPHLARPFLVPGYPVTPVLFALTAVAMAVAAAVTDPYAAVASAALIAAGAAVYALQEATNTSRVKP